METANLNPKVTEFLDHRNHPFRRAIDLLRNIILSANNCLSENIKWNGPNYCYKEQDRFTIKIHPPIKQAQIIFHTGTSKKEQPKNKLLSNDRGLLTWRENDRAVATFKSLEDIEIHQAELTELVTEWIIKTS